MKIVLKMFAQILMPVIFLGASCGNWLAEARPLVSRDNGYLEKTIYLRDLTSVDNITLRSITDYYELSLPIPNRWEVDKATITFEYSNSISILEKRSQLLVTYDKVPITQIRLTPTSPEGKLTVSIPKYALTPGYHRLRFSVVQHSGEECEDPFSPELWTTILFNTAKVTYKYRLRPIKESLSSLSEYFDSKNPIPARIHIVMNDFSTKLVESAVIICTSIANRYDYKPVEFSVSRQLQPGMDNIIIGIRPFVSRLLGTYKDGKNTNANLIISNVPGDPFHLAIFITGQDYEKIRMAALTFASINFPFPNSPELEVNQVNFPNIPPYTGKRLIRSGIEYQFSDLGFRTFVFRGIADNKKKIFFRLPSDLYILPNQYASVYLHLAYGAGLRQDSSLILYLNNEPLASIHLKNPDGEVFEAYKVAIPTYMFRPGENFFSFQPAMIPSESGKCEILKDDHLFITLYQDSRLLFPKMTHWVKMPQLSLLAREGFPFTRTPNGNEVALVIPKFTPDSISAALNILAISAQKNGLPFTRIKAYDKPKEEDLKRKDILFVGTFKQIDGGLFQYAPKSLKENESFRYPLIRSKQRNISNRLFDTLTKWVVKNRQSPKSVTYWTEVKHTQAKHVSPYAILCEFASPYELGRTVVALLGPSLDSIQFASSALWSSTIQASINGDFAILSLGDHPKVDCLELSKSYYTGNLGKIQKVNFFIHRYPWIYVVLVLVCVLTLGIIVYIYLKRRRNKRTAIQGGQDEKS